MSRLVLCSSLLVMSGVACSLANAPADPIDPVASASSSSSSTGGAGGAGGATSTSSSGGQGGTGGVFQECGNNVVEGTEDCDEGGVDTMDCDADCSVRICGDGYINTVAGEVCDDSNIDNGDACDDTCNPTIFVIDGAASGGVEPKVKPQVIATDDGSGPRFAVIYNKKNGANVLSVNKSVYGLDGVLVGTAGEKLNGANEAQSAEVAVNSNGVGVVSWLAGPTAGPNTIRYHLIDAGGGTNAGGERTVTGATPTVANFPDVASSPSNDGFCMLWRDTGGMETLRCVDDSGTPVGSNLPIATSLSNATINQHGSHALFPLGSGYLAAFFTANTVLTGQKITTTPTLDGASSVLYNSASDTPTGSTAQYVTGGIGNLAGENFNLAFGMDRGAADIDGFSRLFNALGNPNGAATEISGVAAGALVERPMRFISRGIGEDYIAVWGAATTAGATECTVLRRTFSNVNVAQSAATAIEIESTNICNFNPSGAVNADGDVMFVWAQTNQAATTVRGIIIPGLLAN